MFICDGVYYLYKPTYMANVSTVISNMSKIKSNNAIISRDIILI